MTSRCRGVQQLCGEEKTKKLLPYERRRVHNFSLARVFLLLSNKTISWLVHLVAVCAWLFTVCAARLAESPTPHYQTFGAAPEKHKTRASRTQCTCHAAAAEATVLCCLRGQYNS